MKKLNLKGKRFGRLLVLRDSGKRAKNGGVMWICVCECGNMAKIRADSLEARRVNSCGCLGREALESYRPYKHGDTKLKWKSRLYCIWDAMKQRCYNLNNRSYKWYGAKGIKVCNNWKQSYSAFKFWAILNGYQEELTIDRINSNLDYNPENCQFITRSENTRKGAKERWKKIA